jgi:TolA-binding protein
MPSNTSNDNNVKTNSFERSGQQKLPQNQINLQQKIEKMQSKLDKLKEQSQPLEQQLPMEQQQEQSQEPYPPAPTDNASGSFPSVRNASSSSYLASPAPMTLNQDNNSFSNFSSTTTYTK